jgi:hypothetical protein
MLRGLQKINPNIRAWDQHTWGLWWPGKARGISTLWIGDPGGANVKITAFNYGAIPEFTQLAPGGDIIAKGWRAIFEKVVRSKAATTLQLEKEFRINLELGDRDTVYCGRCRNFGQFVKSENASGLCNMHQSIRKNVLKMKARQKHRRIA